MARLVVTLALVISLTAACASKGKEPEKQPDAKPYIADFRKKLDEDPEKCAHVWQQIGVHPYERILNGVPSIELCTITRCAKCGMIRHECQDRLRRDRERQRRRTRRSR